jgi:stearoyl-CoA desaturase (delta-9 desaturase)
MKLKKIQAEGKQVEWPTTSNHLPVLSWDQFEEACKTRSLVVISGFIHDVSSFMEDHPGGKAYVKTRLGRDATTAFHGGYVHLPLSPLSPRTDLPSLLSVYDHSNAAQNVLAMLRVGCIEGGYEVETLKKYSQLIADLAVSGGEGVAGKSADLQTGLPTVKSLIKGDPAYKDLPLQPLAKSPEFNSSVFVGGLQ